MDERSLNLTEIFHSIQGETSFSGLPTTFIRLSQCNLRCSWCDTSYSFSKGDKTPLLEIIETTEKVKLPYVCITGGEPLLQENVHPLMQKLCDLRYSVSIETSGSLPIKMIDPRVHVILDIKCPGSGMEKKNLFANLADLKTKDEVKFVLAHREDYDYAKTIINEYDLASKVKEILLSPVHGELDPQILTEWIIEDRLKVRLNLQIHKTIWTPETQGV
jgi:7-carboxy-7-deazaguanine synthase